MQQISTIEFWTALHSCLSGHGEYDTVRRLIMGGMTQVRIARTQHIHQLIVGDMIVVDLNHEPPLYGEFQLV